MLGVGAPAPTRGGLQPTAKQNRKARGTENITGHAPVIQFDMIAAGDGDAADAANLEPLSKDVTVPNGAQKRITEEIDAIFSRSE